MFVDFDAAHAERARNRTRVLTAGATEADERMIGL